MELKLEHLYKNYKKKVALSDVNLTLSEGVYGLLGENGAGKSTLMRILATVDIQTQGAVAFDGTSIIELGRSYRSLVGYMPQDYNVPPGFTAKTFLNYIGALKGIDKKILNRKIPEILEFVNLKEVADNLRDKLVSGVVVLANTTDDKLNLVATATKDAVDKGVHCGNIVKSIAQIAGGKGGGRPNMAQAGAPDVSKVDEALNHASEVLKSQVK